MVIPRYLCILPCVMVIFNISKKSRGNVGTNMQHIKFVNVLEYGALFIINIFFHNEPIILISLVAHLF